MKYAREIRLKLEMKYARLQLDEVYSKKKREQR